MKKKVVLSFQSRQRITHKFSGFFFQRKKRGNWRDIGRVIWKMMSMGFYFFSRFFFVDIEDGSLPPKNPQCIFLSDICLDNTYFFENPRGEKKESSSIWDRFDEKS